MATSEPTNTRYGSQFPEIVNLRKELATLTTKVKNQDSRLKIVEQASTKNAKSIVGIKNDLIDLKRQTTKTNVVLYGAHLPQRTAREDPTRVFLESVGRKYNISLDLNEIANCHRRANGSLIAKFTKFGKESSFEKLVKRHNAWNPKPELHIYASILLTKLDEKIRFYMSKARTLQLIQNFRVERSGRISILRKEESTHKPINTFKDIEDLLTKEVMDLVKKDNEKRAARRRARGSDRHPATEDVDEEEADLMELLGYGNPQATGGGTDQTAGNDGERMDF